MSKKGLWTKDFICVTLCNLFVFLAFYFLIVILPIYTLSELNGSEMEAGLVITLFLITAILIRPFAGKWALSMGNKAILFIGLSIFFISSGLYILADSVFTMLLIRLFHGVGFGIATTATGSIVANVIPNARKGEGVGYYSLSFNLAVVLGPFLGLTAIQQSNVYILFGFVCLSSVLALGMGLSISRETQLVPETMSDFKHKKKLAIVEKTAVRISVVAALFALIYSSILSFVPVFAEEMGLIKASSYFFVIYAAVMLLSRPFTGKWLDQYGANVIVYPCIVVFAIGLFLLSMSSSTFIFLLAAALIGLGWGTLFPTFQTISVQNAPSSRRGLAMATFLSIFDIGIGVGSFIVGMIVASISLHSFYFYSSFILLVGIGIYNMMHGRYATKERADSENRHVG